MYNEYNSPAVFDPCEAFTKKYLKIYWETWQLTLIYPNRNRYERKAYGSVWGIPSGKAAIFMMIMPKSA